MKKTISRAVTALIVALTVSFAMTGCGPEEPGGNGNESIAVTGVSLNHNTLNIDEGDSASLIATISPDNASDRFVEWSSSNTAVVTVNKGSVQAVGVGSATITATCGNKSASCMVTVGKKVIAVTSVTLDHTEIEVDRESAFYLTVTVNPGNATDNTVTWTSSDESIATVSEGIIVTKKVGTVTITAKAGDMAASCKVTVVSSETDKIKAALMKIYDALDGPNWKIEPKWDPDENLEYWHGVEWDPTTHELKLTFNGEFGLKGELPDCFDELTSCVYFFLQDEPGVAGVLPPSFSKLNRLTYLCIVRSSMTSLPDFFDGIPLELAFISGNRSMTGPLPESLLNENILELYIAENNFTGAVPDSWASLGSKLTIRGEPLLPEVIPESFRTAEEAGYLMNMYLANSYYSEKPYVVGDYDIPAYWPKRGLQDVVTGETVPYKDIVSRSKVTVILSWANWCNFSKQLMPLVIRMYDKYHKDGLEIIARQVYDEGFFRDAIKEYIKEHGYDRWYNVTDLDLTVAESDCFSDGETPSAKVVDKNGNILFCGRSNISDPSRGRFGYHSSMSLIPMLEEIFGPLEEEDDYSSTDYSKDGEVMILQKASVGKGINLVFMGDAYTDRDMGNGGLYERIMQQSMKEFFAIEPYKSFQNRFNVYAVKVVSKNGRSGQGCQTALGVVSTGTSISTGNLEKCYEYALKVPAIKDRNNLTIGVIANSNYSRGIATMSEIFQSGIGVFASCGYDPEMFGPTLRHEVCGHAFAFLADEYDINRESPSQEYIDDNNSMYSKYGWYSNIDFTNDPKKVRWSSFLSDSRYKDEVGVFEGGGTYWKGVYRPSADSVMNSSMGYFNAPSRWAIYKRIMELSGETASFSKFLQYDAVNRGKKQNSAPLTRSNSGWEPDAPPVIRP